MRFESLIRRATVAALAAVLSCGGETDTPFVVGDDPPGDSIPGDEPRDATPPWAITDLVISYDEEGNAARLDWTAPADDEADEAVQRYEIRYSFTRGWFPPDFWDLSTPVDDAPDPLAPGTAQSYTFPDLERGKDFFVGIRSYDEADNVSPPSEIPWVHVTGWSFAGRCVDALTGEPLAGLSVTLANGPVFDLTTDANGEFAKSDLFPGGVNIAIATGALPRPYHRLSQFFVLDRDTTHSFVMIPFQQPQAPQFAGISLLALFKFMTSTEASPHLLAKWKMSPVPCYIPPFVNEDGVDYEREAKAAAQRWMDLAGSQIFTFVDSEPESGVIVRYRSQADLAPLIAVTRHTNGPDGHPLRDIIDIVDNMAFAERAYLVMLHEFGHTIRLGHLNYPGFIMYGGQPLPADITPDEVDVVKLHQVLPTRIRMNIYDESNPPFPPATATRR